jgi:hypothetical protein
MSAGRLITKLTKPKSQKEKMQILISQTNRRTLKSFFIQSAFIKVQERNFPPRLVAFENETLNEKNLLFVRLFPNFLCSAYVEI